MQSMLVILSVTAEDTQQYVTNYEGLPVSDWPGTGVSAMLQTTVSLLMTSARADSDRPTQRCASSDVQI